MKPKIKSVSSADCPCGSGQTYAQCCGALHSGTQVAAQCEALMRARYSAYVLHDYAYLRATWAARTCPADLGEHDALQNQTKWLGLRVLRAWDVDELEGYVEFIAKCKIGGGGVERIHEISRFMRENGRWVYVDGEFPVAI